MMARVCHELAGQGRLRRLRKDKQTVLWSLVVRVSRFRGRSISAVYVALRFNTPSVGMEQDFPRRRSMAIEGVRVLATDRALFLSCGGD